MSCPGIAAAVALDRARQVLIDARRIEPDKCHADLAHMVATRAGAFGLLVDRASGRAVAEVDRRIAESACAHYRALIEQRAPYDR